MANSIVSSIIKSYKGRAIRIDPETQYVCITDMAAAAGKFVGHWNELKATKEYLTAFSEVIGIPITDNHAGFTGFTGFTGLICSIQGIGVEQGTWVHPKIAIRFAQWCSVEFAIQVDFWIDELLTTGKVELAVPSTSQLPSRELAVETAIAIDKIQDILSKSNPRLAQILIDCAMNDIIDSQPKLATAEFPEDRWYGLVQIADKMGIKTSASTRTKLGQYISNLIAQGILDVERIKEERLCNGQYQSIWCYRDNDAIRAAIDNWSLSNRNNFL
jgi:KilA-N domain